MPGPAKRKTGLPNRQDLTKKLQLVRVSEEGKEVVGKLAKTDNNQYPFVIQSRNNTYVYLANDGYIYSPAGEKMGYVAKI